MADKQLLSIDNRLSTLNSSYLGGVNSVFLGSSTLADNPYLKRIYTKDSLAYSIPRTGTEDTDSFTLDSSNLTAGNIVVINVDNTTGLATSTTVIPGNFVFAQGDKANSVNFTDLKNLTTDINCIQLMIPPTNTTIPKAVFTLQALYAWYSLLDYNTWNNYSNGLAVTIQIPDLSGTSPFKSVTLQKSSTNADTATIIIPSTSTTTTPTNQLQLQTQISISKYTEPSSNAAVIATTTAMKTNIVTLMSMIIPFSIFNLPGVNPFVARRIIHMHIMMANVNTALTFDGDLSAATVTVQKKALVSALFNLMQSTNLNVTDVNDGTLNSIVSASQKRSTLYNNYQGNIKTNNDNLNTLKDSITIDTNTLASTLQYQSTIKKYQTVAIVMLAIISTGAIFLFITPLEYKNKLMGGAGLIIASVLTAIILQYKNNSSLLTEGFTNNFASTSEYTGADLSVKAAYYTNSLNEASKYLDNSIILAATLDNFHLYGNLNQAANNENAYYQDSVTSLTMKDTNLKDVSKITYMNQVKFSALMNLSIALSLIIAVTMTLVLALDGYTVVRKYISVIGGIFAVIAIIIYILETSTRVHTHPKQKYWGASYDTLQALK